MGTWLLRFGPWRGPTICLLGIMVAVSGLAQDRPLALASHPPETGLIGRLFRLQLQASGGIGSYTWKVVDGSGALPNGLALEPSSGVISGVPTAPGSFSFRVAVTDTGNPPSTETKTFMIEVPEALVLDWKQVPRTSKEGIAGSVVVSNQTSTAMDLTVVIVAVNETGKAFALAEQHFVLNAESDSPVIPFGAENVLPFGRYTIHADAVGEVASENQIYRTRKQTGEDFVIKQQ